MAEAYQPVGNPIVVIPEKPDIEPIENLEDSDKETLQHQNLAGDPELCKAVLALLQPSWSKYVSDRFPYEEIWKYCNSMVMCGQNPALIEAERKRLDKQKNDLTKTKSQGCSSTLMLRRLRSQLAQFINVLFSQKDPYTYTPRYNPDIPFSGQAAEKQAMQHQLFMRWCRDEENFQVKAVEFLWDLLTYGNMPVWKHWIRRSASILDKWPPTEEQKKDKGFIKKLLDKMRGKGDEPSGPADWPLSRKQVMTDNRFTWDAIPIHMFYADVNIADIQQQNVMFIVTPGSLADFYEGQRLGEYINVDQISDSHLYRGGGEWETWKMERDKNIGLPQSTTTVDTGIFMQFDVFAYLPIDETKKGAARWNPKTHEPKKYKITCVGSTFQSNPIVLKIVRNEDPRDRWPIDMIHHYPTPSDCLYHIALGQILRGNYQEATTTKQQFIDSKTLNINRPLKVVEGEVHVPEGEDFTFAKDKVFKVERQESLGVFEQIEVTEIQSFLTYIENDSDEAVGDTRITRGEPMGQRTPASESVNALTMAMLPMKMIIKYVLNQWLKPLAKDGVLYCHCYAMKNQILKLNDSEQVYTEIRPAELYGDFDVQVNIADEYEQNIINKQMIQQGMTNILPFFKEVIDLRKLAPKVLEDYLHTDIASILTPDVSDEQRAIASHENDLLLSGKWVMPLPTDIPDVHLPIHQSEVIAYRGADTSQITMDLLEKHIAIHEQAKAMRQPPQQMAQAEPNAPTAMPGQASGDIMAGQMSGTAGGSPQAPEGAEQ
jgi:hypothetical protein